MSEPRLEIQTIREMVELCTKLYEDKTAFVYPKSRKEDQSVSYRQFKTDIDGLGTWFLHNGYHKAHIALIGRNSYPYLVSLFSIFCSENVAIPLAPELPTEELTALLTASDSTLLLCEDEDAETFDQIPDKQYKILKFSEILELCDKGNAIIREGCDTFLKQAISPQSLAAIYYTSGTTGNPKGVMLSHHNIAINTVASYKNVAIYEGTTVLLLPLFHTFALTVGLNCHYLWGESVYINTSLKTIASDIQKFKPGHLSVVPAMIEILYKKIWSEIEKAGKTRKVRLAILISRALLHLGIDVRRKWFQPVLNALGGRLVTMVCGGAALDQKYIDGFKDFGIILINGYGITECSPVVASNSSVKQMRNSVGWPACCNEVRINPDGEILVRGTNVMLGYYKDPEATQEAMEDDWFKTGDLGYIDKNGALFITGRKKNLIILANGENISAEALENKLSAIAGVHEVVVFEEDQTIAAEIFPEPNTPETQKQIQSDVDQLNLKLPYAQNIGKIHFRETPFPKTASLKIKREYPCQKKKNASSGS